MERGGVGRKGVGGSGQELEEPQRGRHCRRQQSGTKRHLEESGGKHEWREDHIWCEGSDTTEQLDVGAVAGLGLLQDTTGSETRCWPVERGEPIQHGTVRAYGGRGARGRGTERSQEVAKGC